MQIKINKRSAYAPIRYEATRPYARSIGRAFVAQARLGEKARTTFIRSSLLPLVQNAITKLGSVSGPGPVQSEVVSVQTFGEFQDAGRVIFDINQSLTNALLLTDADDVPCEEVVTPAKSFYLHFGAVPALNIDGYDLEGAYVTHAPDRLLIELIAKGFGQPHFFALPIGEATIGVPVVLSDGAISIADALSKSIADVIDHNKVMLKQVAELEQQLSAQYGQVIRVPTSVEDLEKREPLLRRALALIVNTMFYLTAAPDDVIEDWGRDTPQDAVQALRLAAKAGEIKTIENTLANAGYSKVKFVGRVFGESTEARAIDGALDGPSRHVATHFRRGHYRQQPYGPERSLRKRIFVAPVVVNPLQGGNSQGHIYQVD